MNEQLLVDDAELALLSTTHRAELTRKSLKISEVVFEQERARKILRELYQQFLASGLEIESNAPQHLYRPRQMKVRSRPHQIWLWSAASTDLRSESATVYHTHRMLWNGEQNQLAFVDGRPPTRELYTRKVLGWQQSDFEHAFAKCRFGNPRRNIEWWGRRAETLWNEWRGDPFAMYSGGTVNSVMEWKKAQKQDPLPGIGPKIASLIAIFFEEIGMNPVPDAFPVDVHVQRFALALGLVSLTRIAPIMNETLEQILRPALSNLCHEEGWSRITLSHAIWFRGNRGCTNCSNNRHAGETCPVYADCTGALPSKSYFRMGLWRPDQPAMPKGGELRVVPFNESSLFSSTGA